MWSPEDMGSSDKDFGLNPYESFMKKHLQHYGYFTGRNQNYRNGFQQYSEWEKTFTYGEGSASSSSESDTDSDDDKTNDNRIQDELMRTTQLVYSCESGRMVPKLREPRNLYALAKELGPQQAPRWPSEIQVLPDRVHHIHYVPPQPEPFYKPTGTEKTPMCRGEDGGGKVVFEYDPKFSFFMRSRVGGSRNGCTKCCVDLTSDNDTTLLFESRFESGNLAKAVKVNDYEYELWLRHDLYTNKHIQWFYFRVTNTKPNVTCRFTIVNFLKPDSLYNCGMRPCMYSEKEAKLKKVGWVRTGDNIKYYRNNLKYETNKGDRPFYSLTWTMEFAHENDTVYLAHCYPYTYSDLQDYLLELQNDPVKSRICKQRVLCRTLAGNLVYVLTITSASQNPEDMTHKKAVVLTSRVHPGECNASWMMKGFLDYLTGNSADAKLLRDTFIFKIVPMLNPDGVIVGNYRCSLAGRDLNRNYKTVLKDSYPSVWHTKAMIRKVLQERDIIIYCDLHGHSRRQNVFIYGCEQRLNTAKRLHERIFPCMLHKNAPDKFSYDSCKFKVQKSKEGTGRIVMWNMGIMNSYTMEATFCGSTLGKKKGFHFSVADYEAMGYHFCDTLLDYCDPDNAKYANILLNLENRMKMEILARFGRDTNNPADINLSDYASDMESSDGGSDSSVSDGPPVHLQYNVERPLKKKKKLKTRKDRDRARQNQPEEPKKPPQPNEEKTGRGTVDGSKMDKVAPLPFRYSSNSGKRPRSDDRTNSGIPIFVQERFEERQQKRHDYLEALTTAYLRNGIPVNKDPGVFVRMDPRKAVHFRYSERTGDGGPNLPFSLEGLCPHHGQLAAQLAGGAGIGQHGHLTSAYRGDSSFKIWKLLSRRQTEGLEQPPVTEGHSGEATLRDDLVQPQLIPSQSISPLDRQPPSSRPHLLELSSAQQKQQDTVRDSSSSKAGRSHSVGEVTAPNSSNTSSSGKAPVRMRVPSATPVNFRAGGGTGPINISQPITLWDLKANTHSAAVDTPVRDHSHDGRKSRKGMREGEEEDMDTSLAPRALLEFSQGPNHHPPRIKPAHISQDIVDTVDSIRQLQHSLQLHPQSGQTADKGLISNHLQSGQTADTGTYIKHLIQETNNEIDDLTNEIEDEIKHKLQEVRHLQHQQMHSSSINPLVRQSAVGDFLQETPSDSQSQSSATLTPTKLGTVSNEDFQRHDLSHRVQSGHAVRLGDGTMVEGRERRSSVHSNGSAKEDAVLYADPDGSEEMVTRARSARSSRQVIETIPTKISLMICSDHKDSSESSSKQQFLPLYRSVRAPFFRNYNQVRKK